MTGEPLRALARFAAQVDARSLPPGLIEKSNACLLYALAVGAAGMRAKQPAQAVHASAESEGSATRFFDGARCDAEAAAFANGTLFHARVQDDAHPAGHVGVVVVPTALAMAETVSAERAEITAALRIGRDHAADASARGFRTTPIYGVFGAAAAAGRLLRLDEQAMTHALALAANMAGGLREYSECGSEDYAFQAGWAARSGIVAARLAAAGAASGPTALDGKAGFYRAYGEAGRNYAMRVTEHLGDSFEMLGITFKPYPICQFHRSIVRGCALLRERAGTARLDSITVRMHPFEADFFGVRYAGPFATFPQTFMSAPFCAALAWTRGGATFAGLTEFAAGDVLAVVPRVAIVADAERPRYDPRIEVWLANGSTLDFQERDAADAYLLTWEAATRMAAQLGAEVGIASDVVAGLIAAVEAGDPAAIVEAMRGACRVV
jgi:2-methylcitrate dehydratase PrpD